MEHAHKGKGLVILGLLLGIFVAAIDNTIVATSMGTIVSHLGGLDQFVWVTSAYLVTQMAGMPIFGKLSDMYGRKRFFIFGILVFLMGSVLCATATSIIQLSVYRAIQGIGGGALMPIAFTIMFDIIPEEKRGSVGGLFGAVFGTSSLAGPLLGAYLTNYISWRWIFYINVPIGLMALLLIIWKYKESVEHSKQKVDGWGALTLVGSIVCLMFALELGGQHYAWQSVQIIGLFSISALLGAIFLYVETKVAEPIISYAMFKKQLFGASTLVGLLYGAGFIIFSMYIPIYVQGVTGGSAMNSGLTLLPMTLASVVSSQISGLAASRVSYRNIMVVSALVFAAGTFLLGTITPHTSTTLLTIYMVIIGLGVGCSFSILGMAAIHHFDFNQRGAANSTMSFVRSLGMTLGLTVFGIVQRNLLNSKLALSEGAAAAAIGSDPRELLSPASRAALPPDVLQMIIDALSDSISTTFSWALLPVSLAFIAVLFMGNARLLVPEKDIARAGRERR